MYSKNRQIEGSRRVTLGLCLTWLAGCGGSSGAGVAPPDDLAGTVDSLVLSLDSAEVIIDDTVRLSAVPRDATGEPVPALTLVWTSTDPAVATVSSDGLVTAIELGEAEIEVNVAGASARESSAALQLASTAARQRGRSRARIFSVPKLVITPGERSVGVGATVQYTATITNRNDRELRNRPETRWISTDPSVATIDAAGTAKAVREGTTQIGARVTVGRAHDYRKFVTLRVAACGGIGNVQEWDANVQVSYNGTASGGGATITVSQQSSGTTRLKKVPGVAYSWEGQLDGLSSIDNSLVGNGGSVTEKGSGPINGSSILQLVVQPGTPPAACKYHLRYQHGLTFVSTATPPSSPVGSPPPNIETITAPVGIARSPLKDLVSPPGADAVWNLEADETIPGLLIFGLTDPGDEDLAPLTLHGYYPLTLAGLTLFSVAGDPHLGIGAASLAYSLVARTPSN